MEYGVKHIPATIAGTVLLLSGLGKLGDIVGFQRLIVSYGLENLHSFAPFIVLSEILVGSLLVLNVCVKKTSLISIFLLIVFTCAFSYAWLSHGITDCGCFGKYVPVHSSPLLAYLRNTFLLVLLFLSYFLANKTENIPQWKRRIICTIMFAATFVAGMSYRPFAFVRSAHPYERQPLHDTPLRDYATARENESELVFFISYSCPHCINSMENFKAWHSTGKVDKATVYVAVDTISAKKDSLRSLFSYRYPSLSIKEVNKENIDFIHGYPSAFVIKNDTICDVIVGELPSPYLIE